MSELYNPWTFVLILIIIKLFISYDWHVDIIFFFYSKEETSAVFFMAAF